jgi:hypothetical protein
MVKEQPYSPSTNGRDHRRSVRFSDDPTLAPFFSDIVKTLEDASLALSSLLHPPRKLQISTVRGIGVIVDYCEEDSIIAIFCHNKSSGGVLRGGKAFLSQLFASLANRSWLPHEGLRNRACLSVVHRLS